MARHRTEAVLLVDRCSFGNTNEWVSLVWNGHGRRGDHCVRHVDPARWEKIGVEVHPWQDIGKRIVLCGQVEPYSPHWYRMTEWYASHREATHFRPHPAMPVNPTYLPMTQDWDDVKQVITLNSSVAVDAILLGVPTVLRTKARMAWPGFEHGEKIGCRGCTG